MIIKNIQEVLRIRKKLVIRSMAREIQERSDEGDLLFFRVNTNFKVEDYLPSYRYEIWWDWIGTKLILRILG